MKLEELFRTVYSENDFSRSIATAMAGTAGLATYLSIGDVVISVFSAIIVFPFIRIIAGVFHKNWTSQNSKREREKELREKIDSFSDEEKKILRFFVIAGGACVSWGYVNRSGLPFPRPALNSLMARGVVYASTMEDCMTESFVLDTEIFDAAQRWLPAQF
jgi:hypothetical protein